MRKRFLGPLGLVAGFVDSTGGGGWGPVGTPAILASGRLEPRKTIGSIDTSEFLIAVGGIIILTAGAVAYSFKQYQAHRERERVALASA
ncbi:MAG TPA: TSUP family transporter [Solirubrobacteraceae bacterium]|nr:TSUP family transporter [Solirubrobacteraceae bacterium]